MSIWIRRPPENLQQNEALRPLCCHWASLTENFSNCLTVSCIVLPAELSTVHGTHSGWSMHSYFFELKQNTFSMLPSWLFNDLIKKLILELGSWGSTGAMGLMDGKEVMHDRKCRDISIKASGVSGLSFFWF